MFGTDGRCLDVAVDHGTFGTHGFLSGIENIDATVATLVAAGPDAIQLSPGQAPVLQNRAGRKPALVVRTDAGNFYGPKRDDYLFSQMIEGAFERAVYYDAACIVVNFLALPHKPELFHQSVQNVTRARAWADQTGMPLMVEPLAMKPDDTGYGVDGDIEKIVTLVRQAVELGADIIKADPSDETADYVHAVEAAGGRPLLVRGGGRDDTRRVLARTHELMQTGVSGLVYGRNILQHHDPVGMTRALMALTHTDATADEAFALVAPEEA
ncbi:class I fructose-bisphosphate aldolase [Microbacterium sp. NPDC058342]|uniref:class I fructose-bisphosphate aldolase n=1 Tax=Microbacterium sp. NPDC058342 TaxID=3346454 RepID=UPI00366827A1